jgi:inner membrane protein
MDNLTHSLTGLMLSRSGLNRFHPHATLLLFLSANAPDMDVISALGGAGTYFTYHRWITHALIALPLVALLPVIAVRLIFRKHPFHWRPAYLLSLLGVASHLALDWTNPYGIRLFLPFSDAWPALDCTSVVDAWIWMFLLLATLWPMLSDLVGSEMGSRSKPGRGWAIAALCFLPLYNTGRWFLHRQTVELQVSRVYNGQSAQRAFAFPGHFNPLQWSGVVETNSFWVVHPVDLSKDFDPAMSRILYKPESSPAIEAARRTPLFDMFLKFSRTPHWSVTPAASLEGGSRVDVVDLRFGFTVTALVDAQNQVRETGFRFR